MDDKGETEEISYPNLFFHLDNFEEVGNPSAQSCYRDAILLCQHNNIFFTH